MSGLFGVLCQNVARREIAHNAFSKLQGAAEGQRAFFCPPVSAAVTIYPVAGAASDARE